MPCVSHTRFRWLMEDRKTYEFPDSFRPHSVIDSIFCRTIAVVSAPLKSLNPGACCCSKWSDLSQPSGSWAQYFHEKETHHHHDGHCVLIPRNKDEFQKISHHHAFHSFSPQLEKFCHGPLSVNGTISDRLGRESQPSFSGKVISPPNTQKYGNVSQICKAVGNTKYLPWTTFTAMESVCQKSSEMKQILNYELIDRRAC